MDKILVVIVVIAVFAVVLAIEALIIKLWVFDSLFPLLEEGTGKEILRYGVPSAVLAVDLIVLGIVLGKVCKS